MKTSSFERFYYERVALSESCGCAEQIINTRDLDGFARQSTQGVHIVNVLAGGVRMFRRRKRAPTPRVRRVG